MKIIANLPELAEDEIELTNRIASFHANLLIEKIKQLPIHDLSKEKLLRLILENLSVRES